MGLLTLLRKLKRRERDCRVLVLGLDSAGKSSVVGRWLGGPPDAPVAPTLGFEIKSLVVGVAARASSTNDDADDADDDDHHRTEEKTPITMHLWDVGGQETIRAYWRNHFEATDAVVWVVDSTDEARMELCTRALADVLGEERVAGAPLLVLANKRDLPRALPMDDIIQRFEPHKTHAFCVVPCSAVSGQGLDEGLAWLAQQMAARVL